MEIKAYEFLRHTVPNALILISCVRSDNRHTTCTGGNENRKFIYAIAGGFFRYVHFDSVTNVNFQFHLPVLGMQHRPLDDYKTRDLPTRMA